MSHFAPLWEYLHIRLLGNRWAYMHDEIWRAVDMTMTFVVLWEYQLLLLLLLLLDGDRRAYVDDEIVYPAYMRAWYFLCLQLL